MVTKERIREPCEEVQKNAGWLAKVIFCALKNEGNMETIPMDQKCLKWE